MKKLFISMIAALGAMSANAATYTFEDQLVTEGCEGAQPSTVVIEQAADGTYSFTLNEWTCMTMGLSGIGSFTLTGMTGTEADGITTITGAGNADFTPGTNPDVYLWFCNYCSNAPVQVTAKFTADKCYADFSTTMTIYTMENSYHGTFGTDDFSAAAAPTSFQFDDQLFTQGCEGTQPAHVTIEQAADGTYSFSLDEWTCMTMGLSGIGGFTLTGMTGTEADGVTTITGAGNVDFTAGTNPDVYLWFCNYCGNAPVQVTAKFTAEKCYAEFSTTMTMFGMENSYSGIFGTDDFSAAAPTSFQFEDQLFTQGCEGTQPATVTIEQAADGTYSFSLDEWTCMTMGLSGIGGFTLTGMTATEADGVTTITGAGNVDFTAGTNPDVYLWFCNYCSNAPVQVTAKFTAEKCYAEFSTTMTMFGMENSYSGIFGTDDFSTTGLNAATTSRMDGKAYDMQGRALREPAKGQLFIQNGKRCIKL